MDVMSFSEARANFKALMDHVVDDSSPVIVTRQKAGAVVVISLADWQAMQETMHLLSTPANAGRLREAMRELDAGEGGEHDLVQP